MIEDILIGLFFISVVILIYDIVKKKRKKKAIIAVIIFLVLGELVSSLRITDMGYARILGTKKNEVEKKYGVPVENQEPSYCYSEGFHVLYVDNKAALVEIATELVYPGYPVSEGKIMGLSLGDDVSSIEEKLKRHSFNTDTGTKVTQGAFPGYVYKNSKYTLTITCVGSKINHIGLQYN